MSCPLCQHARGDQLAVSELAVAFADAHPVSPGHTLVVPRRHVADYFQLGQEEKSELWSLVDQVRAAIEQNDSPDGYNIGLNVGRAAGQTIDHVHVHVIPRYEGDVDDPRGGLRWVIPERARWWQE